MKTRSVALSAHAVPPAPESGTRLRAAPVSEPEVFAQYEPLVAKFAHRFARAPADVEDLAQEGRIALLRAARSWRPDGGASFLGYAYRSIWGAVSWAARTQARRGFRRTKGSRVDVLSVDAPDDNGQTLHDLIGRREDQDRRVVGEEILVRLRGRLDERCQVVLDGRLQGETLGEIGRRLGVTGEFVRQLEAQIVTKVQRIEEGGRR